MAIALSLPRNIPPVELPSLRLDAELMARALEDDRALLHEARDGTPANALREYVRRRTFLEVEKNTKARTDAKTRSVLRAGADRPPLRPDLGLLEPATLDALRAEAASELDRALAGELELSTARKRLGAFPRLIRAYGLRLDSHPFILRCLYKARWNTMVGLPATEGFRPIEARAYWGWLALHAEAIAIETRLEALDRYERAGGSDSLEARAILLERQGLHLEATAFFARLHQDRHHVRARNNARHVATKLGELR